MLLLGAIAATACYAAYTKYFQKQLPLPEQDPFCEALITETFISALPSLSRELNLEVAKTEQVETLEKSDTRKFCGVYMGTNVARIRMPVTYRFHLRIKDPWQLSIRGKNVVVQAPVIRPSLPPAIHTDQMVMESSRGWCRFGPDEMLQQLHRELTPTLSKYAEDPRRLQFVREGARQSVAEFVRLWLERENRWSWRRFTSIQVQFRDENTLPACPTLQLPDAA
jgi:hypothetical protein